MIVPNKRTITDKRISEKYRQGTSARESCPNDILVELLNKEQGFKKLVDKFTGKYSRGTISKYLKELLKENKISYKDVKLEFGKLERPYCLTKEGLEEAKVLGFVKTLQSLPDQLKTQFILNYKDWVLSKVKNSLFFPYDVSSRFKGHLALPPEYKNDWILLRKSLFPMKIHPNSEIEKLVNAIETDLTLHGFTDEEILKLWVIGNGYLMVRAVKAYGATNFFGALPFKFPPIILSLSPNHNDPEEHKKIVRDALKNYNASDIQKETRISDLFP